MSANRQRIVSAVRSLALTPKERRQLLGEGQNKGGKPGSAGVGTSEADESRLCCNGSTSSNANPGTSERDPDADEAGQGGLDSSDPAKVSSGDGTLSGVTDCATGEPVCFDGSGFIPPDGWDDPNDPPIDPSYDPDVYYSASVYRGSVYPTDPDWDADSPPFQLCSQATQWVLDNHPYLTADNAPCPYTAATYSKRVANCTSSQKSDPSHPCGAPPPALSHWPSDGCTNLSIQGGKIVGSKYDPDQDGSYSAPRDSIDLCDSQGNQISLAPAANGGWKTINSTTNNGYLYDSSGKQIAHIDGNEYSDPSV